MKDILKFPIQRFCDDCGKPMGEAEGARCSLPGCDRVGCHFCTDASDRCLDHIAVDADTFRSCLE